jgi:hypothetical protein
MRGRLPRRVRAIMGVRTRGLDMQAGFKRDAADRAARAEAEGVISALERPARAQPKHAVVAGDPSRSGRQHALARRILPRLRHEPGN